MIGEKRRGEERNMIGEKKKGEKRRGEERRRGEKVLRIESYQYEI